MIGAPNIVVVLDHKLTVGPPHQPIDRLFALEFAADGIQNIALPKVDRRPRPLSVDSHRAAAKLLFDRLQQIDHGDVVECPLELLDIGSAQLFFGTALYQKLGAGRHFVDVNRFRQIVVGAQLEGPHLLFERALFGQKDQRHLVGALIEIEIGAKLQAVAVGQIGIGDDQRRLRLFDVGAGVGDALGDLDAIAGLLKADLEHFLALGFRVDYQDGFVRHGSSLVMLDFNRREMN